MEILKHRKITVGMKPAMEAAAHKVYLDYFPGLSIASNTIPMTTVAAILP
jgi:predicted solute-binding protein